jgi:hypothetical protein
VNGRYANGQMLPHGPFLYSTKNRADLPFTFDIINNPVAHKMFGTFYVCLDALSVFVPAGKITIYGYSDLDFRNGDYRCTAGQQCKFDMSGFGLQDNLDCLSTSGCPNMNLTLWEERVRNETAGNVTVLNKYVAMSKYQFPGGLRWCLSLVLDW